MKYRLVLCAACVPLLVLTVRSFFEAAPAAQPAGGINVQPVQELAADTQRRVQGDEPLVDKLTGAELFHTPADNFPEAQTAKLNAIAETWRLAQPARSFVKQAAALPLDSSSDGNHTPPDEPKQNRKPLAWLQWQIAGLSRQAAALQQQLAPLEEFQGKRGDFVGEVAGAGEFFSVLDRRIAQIEGEITQIEKETFELVKRAVQERQDGNEQACLDTLEDFAADDVRDPAAKQRLEAIVGDEQTLARFWLAQKRPVSGEQADLAEAAGAYVLEEVVAALDAVSREQAAATTFFTQYPNPPTVKDAEETEQVGAAHSDLKQRLDALQLARARLETILALYTQIDNLGKAASLDVLQASAASVAATIENVDAEATIENAFKRSARAAVTTWLTTVAFPAKQPPTLLLSDKNTVIEEALTGNQRRKIGEFKLDGLYYLFRHWNSPRANPLTRATCDELIGRTNLGNRFPPMYVQWAQQYNAQIEGLSGGGSSQQWLEFLQRCQETEGEYAKYQKQWGPNQEPDRSCGAWVFKPDPQVLPHQDLNDLSERLERLQQIFAE